MVRVQADVECPVHHSFRVQQVAGMFDVPVAERAEASFAVDVPSVDEDWMIGLIVGPSGSGKSTIARRAFAETLAAEPDWPDDRAVVDCFGELTTKQITGLLTAVGFSSPPAWIRPYRVLSGGEQLPLRSGTSVGKRTGTKRQKLPTPRGRSSCSTNSRASSIATWRKSARPRWPSRFAAARFAVASWR